MKKNKKVLTGVLASVMALVTGGALALGLSIKLARNVDILKNESVVVAATAPTNSTNWLDSSSNYTTTFSGSGTEADPYLIANEKQLAGLSYNVKNNRDYSDGKYFKQTKDLDMKAYYWTPIGSGSYYFDFAGNYDGGGHTVSGIFTKDIDYAGLFGRSGYGEIKNVGVINSNIQGNYAAGGIYGGFDGSSGPEVSQCYSENCTITGTTYAGGICGALFGLRITDCYNKSTIIGSGASSYAGGIAGYLSYGGQDSIQNCINAGSVSANTAGGILGYLSYISSGYVIEDVFAYGSVSGATRGAIIGKGPSSGDTTNAMDELTCRYEIDVYENTMGFGESDLKDLMTKRSYFNSSWDFDNTWYIEDGIVPRLRVFGLPTNWIDLADNEFAGGTGTSSDPYKIKNPTQLAYLAKQVNAGTNYSGVYFKQVADLDLGGYDWTPIGAGAPWSGGYSFKGTFDGGERNITNMSIKNIYNYSTGLFGKAENATFKNVIIKDSYINNPGYGCIGGLVGCGYSSTILDSSCNIKISDNSNSSSYVGGFVGYMSGGSITSCINRGSLQSAKGYVGGIVGENASSATITSCQNEGDLKGAQVGGIAGVNSSKSITNSMSCGIIEGSQYIGGLVGRNNGSSLANSVSTSMLVKTESSCKAGAIVGYMVNQNTVSSCVYVGGSDGSEVLPFYGEKTAGSVSNCYSIVNRQKYYSSGSFGGFARLDGVNNGMPVVKSLYHVAQFMNDVNASWFANNGFTLVSA